MRETYETLGARAAEWQRAKAEDDEDTNDIDSEDAETSSPEQEDPPSQNPSGDA